jgi:hypothetical protein
MRIICALGKRENTKTFSGMKRIPEGWIAETRRAWAARAIVILLQCDWPV